MTDHPYAPLARLTGCALAAVLTTTVAVAQSATGTIKGHVHVMGKAPGNPVIRMGVDPMCRKLNAGKLAVQEAVVASRDGSLANVFVKLHGAFPPAPVPAAPVVVDQQSCFYVPRVVGVRVGQKLEIRNSDTLFHNVHSLSTKDNGFNVAQPLVDMVYTFQPKSEETMVHLTCDTHRWMHAWVGIVSHPYFAVSDREGGFEIAGVPAGTQTVEAWHERFGAITQTVRVRAGAVTTVDVAFDATEKSGD